MYCRNYSTCTAGIIERVLQELLSEDVVKRLIGHKVQLTALLDLKITSEVNNSCNTQAWTVP